jgi:signal transduction histidine kinase
MNALRSFITGTDPHDPLWPCITLGLSAAIIVGYGVIAFNWYLKSRFARHAEAATALARLRNICLACGVCGWLFFALEIPWFVWRLYDIILLLLVFHTWTFIRKTRGLSLGARLTHLAELERSAVKYREIAELLPHMVWTATAEGRVDFSNLRWRHYVRDKRTWLGSLHPDEQDEAIAQWLSAVGTRTAISLELRLRGADGYRTFLVKAQPIFHGDEIKWLGACADIEDQKQLAAEKELAAKQKNFFLNALSHDLRAPLHNLLLNAQLLKMSSDQKPDPESLDMIISNAVAAGDLVSRLLDFAKVGATECNNVERVDLSDALDQIVQRFLPIAQSKGLTLERRQGTGAAVTTDRQKLLRIVSNLVDNALKYTDTGGVMLCVEQRNDRLAICVADTGIGVPHQSVPFLFDEFYQVDNHERDKTKGFGMGLAICKSLAGQIRGDVRLARTGPQGSCFELLLPTRQDNSPDRGGRALGPPGHRSDPRPAGTVRV